MKESFYEICIKCHRTFTDKAEYDAHKKSHAGKGVTAKPIEEVKKKIETAVPADDSAKKAEISEINMMKKRLQASGVEAQTMTSEQVKIRFAEERAKGNIK